MWDTIDRVVAVLAAASTIVLALQLLLERRPLLIAEFRESATDRDAIDLVIRNLSATTARNVSVSFEPDVRQVSRSVEAMWIDARYRESDEQQCDRARSFEMSAGTEISNAWKRRGHARGTDSLPDEVTVTIRFTWGWLRCRRTFRLNTITVRGNSEWIHRG